MRAVFRGVCLPLALLALPAAAAGQAVPRINITQVRVGFPTGAASGAFKAGAWTAVSVDVTVGNEPFRPDEAVLEVQAADHDDVQNVYKVRVPALHPGEQRTLVSYTRPGSAGSDLAVVVRDAGSGRVLAEAKLANQTYEAFSPVHHLFLSAGGRLPGLKRAFAKQPKQGQEEDDDVGGDTGLFRFAYADAGVQLPSRWYGYGAVDMMVLTSGSEAFIRELLEDQQNRKEALAEWVRRGGRLVVSAGRNQQFVKELLTRLQLLNCDLTGTVTKPRLNSVQGWARAHQPFVHQPRTGGPAGFELTKLEPGPGTEVLVSEPPQGEDRVARPVLVQAPCGLGRVVLVAFDLDRPPFTSWGGQSAFWQELHKQVGYPLPAEQAVNQQVVNPFGYGADANELGSQLRNRLETFPEVPVVSFGWVALFILIYIIIVGPLDYLFLKKVVKRLELTWVTFPAVVLIVSAVAYFTAYYLKGNDLRINKVDLVEIDLRTPQVQGTTWLTLFSPRIQHYTVGVEPNNDGWAPPATRENEYSTVVSWLARPDNFDPRMRRGGTGGLFRRSYEYAADASGLRGVPIQVWSTKSFTASWTAPMPAGRPLVEAELKAKGDFLQGRITSNLPADLRDVTLLYRGKQYKVDDLLSGGSVLVQGVRTHNNPGGEIQQWLEIPFPGAPPAPRSNRGSGGTSSVGDLVKRIWFHEASPQGRTQLNATLRHLDQSWRIQPADRRARAGEVVLCGRLKPLEGPANEVAGDAASASRLWLGELPAPGGGQPPALSGVMSQETYVRVFIPVNPE